MLSIDVRTVGPIKTNCWLVKDMQTGDVLVVDPGDRAETILQAIGEGRVAAIVLTHNHDDHKGALPAVVQATGAPVVVHELDASGVYREIQRGFASPASVVAMQEAVNEGRTVDRTVTEGDSVQVGGYRFEVIHTPGHTEGSMCLYCASEKALFCGDTLFEGGGYGRTDFPGGSWKQMLQTLDSKFKDIPGDVTIYPGHGPTSTLEAERELNPYLR